MSHGLYRYTTGCRCEVCRAANRDNGRRYRQRLAARGETPAGNGYPKRNIVQIHPRRSNT